MTFSPLGSVVLRSSRGGWLNEGTDSVNEKSRSSVAAPTILAMVLVAVAVAIVGVVVLRGNSESLNRNEPFQRWDCRY